MNKKHISLVFLLLALLAGQAEALRIGWDPDGDYGAGDSWATQVDQDDYNNESRATGILVSMPAGGPWQGDSIHVYLNESMTSNAHNNTAAIYDSGGTKVTNGETNCRGDIATGGYAWYTFTFSTPPSLSASTDYYILLTSDSGGGDMDIRTGNTAGDCTNPLTGTNCGRQRDTSITAPCSTLDTTVSISTGSGRTVAIYLTYSSTATGIPTPPALFQKTACKKGPKLPDKLDAETLDRIVGKNPIRLGSTR